MQRRFQRKKEDFLCAHCGAPNTGNGYTNHCQQCLWSLHVDINPGDRAESCCGLMTPVAVENSSRTGYLIVHQCTSCGEKRRVKSSPGDNFETLLRIARVSSEEII